jgi:hypothetical protein
MFDPDLPDGEGPIGHREIDVTEMGGTLDRLTAREMGTLDRLHRLRAGSFLCRSNNPVDFGHVTIFRERHHCAPFADS